MARFGSRYGELDEEIGDANNNVLSSPSPNDISAMDTQDASKHLFGKVDWDEFLRTEVFLSQTEVIVTNSLICSSFLTSLVSIIRKSSR
jgi:hypothetical protein